MGKTEKEAEWLRMDPRTVICTEQSDAFPGFVPCHPEQPRPFQDTERDTELSRKETDMWIWQLVLTPTHWEGEKVYCFSWYLVFGDILFIAVIFRVIQLLYFESWVWEKSSFLGTSPHLSLQATATVLYHSFFLLSLHVNEASGGRRTQQHQELDIIHTQGCTPLQRQCVYNWKSEWCNKIWTSKQTIPWSIFSSKIFFSEG